MSVKVDSYKKIAELLEDKGKSPEDLLIILASS